MNEGGDVADDAKPMIPGGPQDDNTKSSSITGGKAVKRKSPRRKSITDSKGKKVLTAEEKKAKKVRDELSNAKAKELLGQYIKKYRCLMFFGFFFNVTGMVGEFVTPLFIGKVIDAIT
jgi:hypothetical protein